MRFVAAPDGTQIALREFGGDGPPLLVSHANGFHGHCYRAMSESLAERFRCFAIDHRGHGATTIRGDWFAPWSAFGDDTLAVARELAPDGGLIGFGHSMGASALLMAAHQEPDRFERLVLFEPIAAPAEDAPADPEAIPLVQGARRRRARFASRDGAFDNYKSKPPLSMLDPDVLRDYVDHGLRNISGGEDVELCCAPALEAEIYVHGFRNGVWEMLPEITVPTLVLSGAAELGHPASVAEGIAARLPHGTYRCLNHLTHFGPFTHPAEVAAGCWG